MKLQKEAYTSYKRKERLEHGKSVLMYNISNSLDTQFTREPSLSAVNFGTSAIFSKLDGRRESMEACREMEAFKSLNKLTFL